MMGAQVAPYSTTSWRVETFYTSINTTGKWAESTDATFFILVF